LTVERIPGAIHSFMEHYHRPARVSSPQHTHTHTPGIRMWCCVWEELFVLSITSLKVMRSKTHFFSSWQLIAS